MGASFKELFAKGTVHAVVRVEDEDGLSMSATGLGDLWTGGVDAVDGSGSRMDGDGESDVVGEDSVASWLHRQDEMAKEAISRR